MVEKFGCPSCLRIVKQGAVDVYPEPSIACFFDRARRDIENALLVDGAVMLVFQPIEMDRESQVRRRFEQVQFLFQKQRVGAEIDELLTRDQRLDDFANFLVDKRFAAGDRYNRCATFLGRLDAFRNTETAVQDRVRIIDLAATGTGKVAAEQRFQH